MANPTHRRPRILQAAHACEPYHGSEQAVGWNWALQAGKTCEVWVVCCEDDCRPTIEQYCAENGPVPHLHFVFVPRSALQRWILALSKIVRFVSYFSYRLWHYKAYRVAKELHKAVKFDIVHHVTFSGYREPGYLWKLDIPFVWGPIGGTQNCPLRFSLLPRLSSLKEALRTLFNSIQLRTSLRVRTAASRASAILAANSTVMRDVEKHLRYSAIQLCENGITRISTHPREVSSPDCPLRILWAGGLQFHKNLDLLLHALSQLPEDVSYELRVVGDGPLRDVWKRLASRLKLADRITWMGRIPHDEALKQFPWADVFAFTSLRDTNGTVMLEALAEGVPVICLDHQRAHDLVTEQCGIKIPVTTPVDAANSMRAALEECARNRKWIARMSEHALDRAKHFAWTRQGERMARIYQSALRQETPAKVRSDYPRREAMLGP